MEAFRNSKHDALHPAVCCQQQDRHDKFIIVFGGLQTVSKPTDTKVEIFFYVTMISLGLQFFFFPIF